MALPHDLAEDCRVAQRELLEAGDEVPEWVSLTAVVDDPQRISEAARDLWFRLGWVVKS